MSASTDSLDIRMTIVFPDDSSKSVSATVSAELIRAGAVEYVADIGGRMAAVLTRETTDYVATEAQKK